MFQAPGWYRDPGGSTAQRWWSGIAWTDHVQPGPHRGAVLSSISLGLGILACLGSILPFIGLIVATAAVVLGFAGYTRSKRADRSIGLSVWGITLGFVGGVINLALTIFVIVLSTGAGMSAS